MDETYIRGILEEVSGGRMSVDEALNQVRDLPYKDMGFANIDHHRAIRTGFPEVVFGEGKTPQQMQEIFRELTGHGRTIFATRASREQYEAVAAVISEAVYYETARIIAVRTGEQDSGKGPAICVISAGTADIPVAEEAAVTAELLGNEVTRFYDIGVAGIHRLFDKLDEIRKADVVIAVAGMEGALASVIGGLVDVPVIGVPTSIGYGANMQGLSVLLSMLNSCANGVSVVNIDNGFGAAYNAALITRRRNQT